MISSTLRPRDAAAALMRSVAHCTPRSPDSPTARARRTWLRTAPLTGPTGRSGGGSSTRRRPSRGDLEELTPVHAHASLLLIWGTSTVPQAPPTSAAPGKAVATSKAPPTLGSAPAKPWRSSKPLDVGSARQSRGAPRSPSDARPAPGKAVALLESPSDAAAPRQSRDAPRKPSTLGSAPQSRGALESCFDLGSARQSRGAPRAPSTLGSAPAKPWRSSIACPDAPRPAGAAYSIIAGLSIHSMQGPRADTLGAPAASIASLVKRPSVWRKHLLCGGACRRWTVIVLDCGTGARALGVQLAARPPSSRST